MTSTQKIDFKKLTLCNALDLAILIEEEACERYQEFTAQLEAHHTPEAAKFFAFMARNEERHRVELNERRKKLFPNKPRVVKREMLFDVEAPEYHQAGMNMTARQALLTALSSEEKAFAFFRDALPAVVDAEVKALFEELQGEEIQHQQLVKKELAKLPADDGFDPKDFEDEPVEQD